MKRHPDAFPDLAVAIHAHGCKRHSRFRQHHAVKLSAGIRVDGAWHVQNVNAYHSRLKGWIYKFRGVATCYLANYLGWFRTLDREQGNGPKPAQWLAMALGGRLNNMICEKSPFYRGDNYSDAGG